MIAKGYVIAVTVLLVFKQLWNNYILFTSTFLQQCKNWQQITSSMPNHQVIMRQCRLFCCKYYIKEDFYVKVKLFVKKSMYRQQEYFSLLETRTQEEQKECTQQQYDRNGSGVGCYNANALKQKKSGRDEKTVCALMTLIVHFFDLFYACCCSACLLFDLSC